MHELCSGLEHDKPVISIELHPMQRGILQCGSRIGELQHMCGWPIRRNDRIHELHELFVTTHNTQIPTIIFFRIT